MTAAPIVFSPSVPSADLGAAAERVANNVAICSSGTFANSDAGGSIIDGFQLAAADTRRDIAMLELIYKSFSSGGANCSSSICGDNASNEARDEDIKANGTRANARADHADASDRASDADAGVGTRERAPVPTTEPTTPWRAPEPTTPVLAPPASGTTPCTQTL